MHQGSLWSYGDGHGKLGAYAQANKHGINNYLHKNDSHLSLEFCDGDWVSL